MITFEEFIEKYRPLKNHLVEDAPFGGYMYETVGKEIDYILPLRNKDTVWTVIEDDGYMYIIPGYHWINRIGYILTEVPWSNFNIEVNLNEI